MLTVAETEIGELVSIDALAAMDKAARPYCRCFACHTRLIPHTGDLIAHHFAHASDVPCVAAGGEGALHLEAKLRLKIFLQELAGRGDTISSLALCPDCERYSPAPLVTLCPGDEIHVERKFERYRPDICVQRSGRVVAAFEVLVTHACDSAKWDDFCASDLVAVELFAKDILSIQSSEQWVASGKTPFQRVHPSAPALQCPACTEAEERERRRPREENLVRCFVDVRYLNGSRAQQIFEVWRRWDGEQWADGSVRVGMQRVREFTAAEVHTRHNLLALARTEYLRFLEQFGDKNDYQLSAGRIVDGRDISESYRVPGFWWEKSRDRWVECYSWEDLPQVFPDIRFTTLAKWSREGRLVAIRVQRSRGANMTRMFTAVSVNELARWWERTRNESPQIGGSFAKRA